MRDINRKAFYILDTIASGTEERNLTCCIAFYNSQRRPTNRHMFYSCRLSTNLFLSNTVSINGSPIIIAFFRRHFLALAKV